MGLTKFLPDIRVRFAQPPEREMHEGAAQGQQNADQSPQPNHDVNGIETCDHAELT